MLRISKIAVAAVIFLVSANLQSQNIYSPYTVYGIGDLTGMDLVTNIAMGGVGIGNPNPFHLNNKNPALLIYNRVVVFETSLTVEQKMLSTEDLSQDSFTGGLGYLALGLPIIRETWSMSFGLIPYSIVNYESQDLGFVPGTNTQLGTRYIGSGGVTQAYFATGLKVTKGLSLGFRAAYLFGSIDQETEFQVQNTDYLTAYVSKNSYSDVTLGFGAAYSLELLEDQNYLNFGITYDLGGDQKLSRLEQLERRGLTGDRQSPDDEPPYLVADNLKGSENFPSTLGLGLGYEKRLKWTIAADITLAKWSEYQDFDGDSGILGDRTEIAVGGSYIPDAFSVGNYLDRITYMVGFNYQKTPYLVNEQEIDDFGINFGVTLPLRDISRLSLAFKVGRRGTTDNDLIKENYFRAYLGITVNDNRWFIRRKFD